MLLAFAATKAVAADVLAGIPLGGFGSDLHATRDEVELESGSSTVKTRLTHFGLAISEDYGDHLALGLLGGYALASQRRQALTEGFDFTGPYAGVNLQAVLPLGRRFRVELTGQYVYQWLDDETQDQRVKLEWSQADATLNLQVDVTTAITLYAGPLYSDISVDQTAKGAVDSTTDFDGRRSTGAIYGVQLEVDPRGWVGLELRQGPMEGVALSFQRRF
jgi:hypothetical protein